MERLRIIDEQITQLTGFLSQIGSSEPKRDQIEHDIIELYYERERIEDRNYCVFCCMHHMPEEGCVHHAIDGAIG